MMLDEIARRFRDVAPPGCAWSLRVVHEGSEEITVRRDVTEPPESSEDLGVMATVAADGGVGYAATSDVSGRGLAAAAEAALAWARRSAGRSVPAAEAAIPGAVRGEYASPTRVPWASVSLADKIERLRALSARLHPDPRIVDWHATLWRIETETLIVTSAGGEIRQRFDSIVPLLEATANDGPETQTRTFGGHAWVRQGGLEALEEVGFDDAAGRIPHEAIELLLAPNCPSGTMDVLLAPDQMILQIHESIGHPLELDRILGDERNYAGTSFVTPEMFGVYRYGSELLNVAFDPTVPGELASYAFDDEGEPARKEWIIREGVLLRPLGGRSSQRRAGLAGVATARADGWNRPPIDRMANLNLEPGSSPFDELVGATERGVWMETNRSWSIDDSRNKFQFGCERGRVIENGRLGTVVKNPNYRGVSATFWRSLAGVGDRSTFRVMGTPFCGKGEPNQIMRVGHASPVCRFAGVEVFGGA
jgi:predicted Zn-dependent protease